jgi:histidinol-phosphate aminotransferase
MQTFSKAWGLAALRLGIAFAQEELIQVMNRIKPPYNINQASQELALKAMDGVEQVNDMIVVLVEQRELLRTQLQQLPMVEKIFPSDANFLLVKTKDGKAIYDFLLTKGIVVRDRSRVELCEGCLRITVGTESENNQLVHAMAEFN